MLPKVLASLTVNGRRMDASALRTLPDPLVFPEFVKPETPEASATPEASPVS